MIHLHACNRVVQCRNSRDCASMFVLGDSYIRHRQVGRASWLARGFVWLARVRKYLARLSVPRIWLLAIICGLGQCRGQTFHGGLHCISRVYLEKLRERILGSIFSGPLFASVILRARLCNVNWKRVYGYTCRVVIKGSGSRSLGIFERIARVQFNSFGYPSSSCWNFYLIASRACLWILEIHGGKETFFRIPRLESFSPFSPVVLVSSPRVSLENDGCSPWKSLVQDSRGREAPTKYRGTIWFYFFVLFTSDLKKLPASVRSETKGML